MSSGKIFRAILFLFILFAFYGCKVGRFFWYNFSDITDYKIFPSRPLEKGENTFQFINAADNATHEKRIRIRDYKGDVTSLDTFLENSPTVAFLVIRNDSILYERYFDEYNDSSIVGSFSVAKSYVSALVGIAIGEGFIKSEDDSVVTYIPELRNRSGWNHVTIHHLLHMSSGVKFSEGYYTPFSGAASTYYGRTLRRTLLHAKTYRPPMQEFEYKSINTSLLGLIVERATKKDLTSYLEEKIWKPAGMEFDASWSIDKKKNGIEKAFCCLNMRARDYARFGRLYLRNGNWEGKQLIPADWVKKSTMPNNEEGSAVFYNRQWWIGAKEKDFAAIGHLGQYIYVKPGKNLIIIRLGKSRAKEDWMHIIRQAEAAF